MQISSDLFVAGHIRRAIKRRTSLLSEETRRSMIRIEVSNVEVCHFFLAGEGIQNLNPARRGEKHRVTVSYTKNGVHQFWSGKWF